MSKPPFSRKRKGKKVDPYPLGSTRKGKSSQTKKSSGRPRKPKPVVELLPMTEERFWSIIERAGPDSHNLKALLRGESDEDLYRFQMIWVKKMDELHHADVWNALQDAESLTMDSTDYAMMGVIASGKEFFDEVLENPKGASAPDGELFSYAVMDVWESRHGEDSDFFEDGYDAWEEGGGTIPERPTGVIDCSYCGGRHRIGSQVQREHASYAGMTIDRRGPLRKAGEFKKDVLKIVEDSDPMTTTAIARKASEMYPYRDPGGTGMYMWTVEQLEDLVDDGKAGIYFGKMTAEMQVVKYGRPNDTELVRSPSGRLIVLKGYVGKYTIGRSPIPSHGGKPYFAWPEGAGTRRDWDKIGRGRSPDEALADAKRGSR